MTSHRHLGRALQETHTTSRTVSGAEIKGNVPCFRADVGVFVEGRGTREEEEPQGWLQSKGCYFTWAKGGFVQTIRGLHKIL